MPKEQHDRLLPDRPGRVSLYASKGRGQDRASRWLWRGRMAPEGTAGRDDYVIEATAHIWENRF